MLDSNNLRKTLELCLPDFLLVHISPLLTAEELRLRDSLYATRAAYLGASVSGLSRTQLGNTVSEITTGLGRYDGVLKSYFDRKLAELPKLERLNGGYFSKRSF